MRYKVVLNSMMRGQPMSLTVEADGFEVKEGCLCFNRYLNGGEAGGGLTVRRLDLYRAYAPGVWRAVEVSDDNAPSGVVDVQAQRRERLWGLIPEDSPEGTHETPPGDDPTGSVPQAR